MAEGERQMNTYNEEILTLIDEVQMDRLNKALTLIVATLDDEAFNNEIKKQHLGTTATDWECLKALIESLNKLPPNVKKAIKKGVGDTRIE